MNPFLWQILMIRWLLLITNYYYYYYFTISFYLYPDVSWIFQEPCGCNFLFYLFCLFVFTIYMIYNIKCNISYRLKSLLTCTFIPWLLNSVDLPRYNSESRKKCTLSLLSMFLVMVGGVWQVMRVLEIVLPGGANDLSGERVYLWGTRG